MLDRSFIGRRTAPEHVDVELNQLRFFAKATGETDPIYTDRTAAQAAGYRDVPAPPTFAFTLNQLSSSGMSWLREMGIPIGSILHGEQAFEFHRPIHAGDRITLVSEILDIYAKKGGSLEFIVRQTDALSAGGELCVRQRSTVVVRNQDAQP